MPGTSIPDQGGGDGKHKKMRCGNGDAGGSKSFSLFAMMDAQGAASSSGPGIGMARASADDIMQAFRTDGYARAAELIEHVDDLEDLLYDPFGSSSHDLWPDVNRILRSGLGIRRGEGLDDLPPPAPDVVIRFASLHSQLDALCDAQSSSLGGYGGGGANFGPQRVDLVTNLSDAMEVFAGGQQLCSYEVATPSKVNSQWEGDFRDVRIARVVSVLVRTWRELFPRALDALESIPDDGGAGDRLLSGAMRLVVNKDYDGRQTAEGAATSAATSAIDPYADWFAFAARSFPPARIAGLAAETGLVDAILARCEAGQRESGTVGDVNMIITSHDADRSRDLVMVRVGTVVDIEHCLLVQSLSILRTLLVVTAGSPVLFPYVSYHAPRSGGAKEHRLETSFDNMSRFLIPFVTVLSIGISHGEALVDKDLAALCEEAVETVLPCLERVATTSDQTLAFFVGKFRKALSNTDEVTPSVLSFIKICQRLAGSIDGSKGNSIALEGQSADCLENITRTLELILN